jgi:hypothetical protein
MTKEQIRAALDRVLTWPPERQEEAVQILSTLEELDRSPLQLSDEQAAEIQRRLDERDPETLSLTEFEQRLKRFGV